MMPIRDVVIFPHMMTPFVVGRESSVRALEEALASDKKIFLATQHDASVDEPKANEIYQVGTVVNIVQSLKLPDGNIKVLVEGIERGKVLQIIDTEGFMQASVRLARYAVETNAQLEAAMQRVTSLFEQYVKLCQSLNYETMIAAVRMEDPAKLTDTIAANLQLSIEEKQELLEIFDPADRLTRIADVLDVEIEKLNMDRTIQSRVKRQMERAQKEYYLNEKIKAIQKELGRGEKSEFDELKKKVENAGMPKEVKDKALQELKKLEAMPPMSAESTVSRNYLDWLLAVPWKKRSKEIRNISRAEKVLNEDHYGLEKIKERILEFLAVRQLVKNPKGSILCFVGPPGVGKTSLGMSIAKATGRKFVRMSLGGVRDEAEIRGHRRTYIGALPGQIIQMMKKAGTKNPVFMLDEVDKMSMDFRGDPSAALLEVLDPEQNFMFIDHYLDVEYDLSQVFFVATANVLHTIPPALQDRMEVLRLHGYTEPEKVEIAKQFLVKKQMEQAGLNEKNVKFTDDAITSLIRSYTREAGVRNLEREIGNVCRKIARKVVKEGSNYAVAVTTDNVNDFLGVIKFRDTVAHEKSEVGLVTGLAWTEVGGSILSTEATVVDGKGKLTLTGKLGDVMQESAHAAMSYIRSRASRLGLTREFYRNFDIHVHVPEGAIPKDGPSAGITIATAIASSLSKIPVRRDLAMTGEITLRGKVLPIGGLKEKLLAAHRAGLFEVILPKDNEKDVAEVPENLRSAMKLHFVDTMDQVLAVALEQPLPETGLPAEAQPIPLTSPSEGPTARQ
ncbi:MAG: endopeptidase La [Acidobacteria bacterium]|nr:MAG: endopeptidase La [Acidobacteriota bacterium]PYV77473.1 MAG: endopeptidase La [Acidobacteriota bacterium]